MIRNYPDANINNMLYEAMSKKDINILKDFIESKRQKRYISNKTSIKMNIFGFVNESKNTRIANIGNRTIRDLILLTGDIDYIKQCENELDDWQLDLFDKERIRQYTTPNQIDLPKGMTYGIEIESEGENSINLGNWKKIFKKSWKDEFDASLRDGLEIISPKFESDENKQNSKEIKSMCAIIEGFYQEITKRCGGHIHIGADYFDDVQDWKNLIEIYTNTENILFTIANASGETPRSGIEKYAPPITEKINKIKDKLNQTKSIDEFINVIKNIQPKMTELYHAREDGSFLLSDGTPIRNKSAAINFLNVGSKDKNTIEFRIPNGTINPNIWIDNINLFGGLMRVSKELTAIQKKEKSELTEEDENKLRNFNYLKEPLEEELKINPLLNLCVGEKNKRRFLERYVVNKKLRQMSEPSIKVSREMYERNVDFDFDFNDER